MQAEFWLKKWRQPTHGFQQAKVNSRLKKLFPADVPSGSPIFVPLCGDSIDMVWLMEQGYRVFGVELSEVACERFFPANGIDFEKARDRRFIKYRSQHIEIWQGDYFSLSPEDLSGVQAVYDRAALIALPEKMRRQYARCYARLLHSGCRVLLISMDYDETKMQGPPFSVHEAEVERLFSDAFDIAVISRSSGPDIVGNLTKRGLDTLNETIYLLTRI